MLSCFCSLGRVGSVFSELLVLLEAEGELLFLSTEKSNLVIPRAEDSSVLSLSSLEYVNVPTSFCQDWLSAQTFPPPYSRSTSCRTDSLSACLESQDSAPCLPRLAGPCCFHPYSILTFRWFKEFSSLKTNST